MPAQSFDNLIALEAYVFRRTVGDREVVCGAQYRNLPLTDEGVNCLRDYVQILAVGLSGTKITNRSLPMLITLPHLKGTRVSPNGASELQAALPWCQVCT